MRDLFFVDQERGRLITVSREGKWASVARFISREIGFVFVEEGKQHMLMYSKDGGEHWHKRVLPRFVYDCQIFEGDLLCSAGPGFRLLTLHPK